MTRETRGILTLIVAVLVGVVGVYTLLFQLGCDESPSPVTVTCICPPDTTSAPPVCEPCEEGEDYVICPRHGKRNIHHPAHPPLDSGPGDNPQPKCDKVGLTLCKYNMWGAQTCKDPCGNTWTKQELIGTDICVCSRTAGGVVELWPCDCK